MYSYLLVFSRIETDMLHVLQDFLKSKSVPVSGKKADLVERVVEWLDTH